MRSRRGGSGGVEIAHAETILERGEEVWSWSSPAGLARRERRVKLITECLRLGDLPGPILELGCGTGIFTQCLAPRCQELVAADIGAPLLALARERVPADHVRFVQQDLESIDPQTLGRGFCGVYGISVLHHLDLEKTLPQLREVLEPGADLVFSEPNLLNPQVQLMFSRFGWARRRWATSDTEMAFYPRELREVFEQHGYEVVRSFPFDFLHPAIPGSLVPLARRFERVLERTPLLRFLAGSCFIHARAS